MTTQSEAEKLRSVNVKMTVAMTDALDRSDSNRSRIVRRILAAILQAHSNGQSAPFEEAVAAAHRSSTRTQRMTQSADVGWRKAIVWIPERMHQSIIKEMRAHELRPADFIRGSVIGFTGEDPTADIVREGHELWSSQVVEEDSAATGD